MSCACSKDRENESIGKNRQKNEENIGNTVNCEKITRMIYLNRQNNRLHKMDGETKLSCVDAQRQPKTIIEKGG